jgi:hypothetical protein
MDAGSSIHTDFCKVSARWDVYGLFKQQIEQGLANRTGGQQLDGHLQSRLEALLYT